MAVEILMAVLLLENSRKSEISTGIYLINIFIVSQNDHFA